MKYMTTTPHSIGSDQSLKVASSLMDQHHIRHLPVLKNGKVTGIISERDIRFATSFRDADPAKITVDDISKEEVYVVSPESKLEDVAGEMSHRKLGSAIVMDNGKLVGIFTAVDGLGALAELLKTRDHSHGGSCC